MTVTVLGIIIACIHYIAIYNLKHAVIQNMLFHKFITNIPVHSVGFFLSASLQIQKYPLT